MAQSQAMNSQCCSGSSHCDGGVPSDCNAACAGVFMPFWSQCQRFTEQNLPELVSFGRKCATASSGSPPPPPPSGGTPTAPSMLQATFSFPPGTVDLTSNKRKARFESNLRSDIGSALDIPSSAVLIDSDQAIIKCCNAEPIHGKAEGRMGADQHFVITLQEGLDGIDLATVFARCIAEVPAF